MSENKSENISNQAQLNQPETQKFAFFAMTFLFFFWGFITVLNDLLIPFLKETYDLSYTQASLVQFCFSGRTSLSLLLRIELLINLDFRWGWLSA